jgi:hypothetical protein
MKKQTLAMMEQSRKASERESIACQQAEEAMASKEAAISEAEKATARENLMLDLIIEASADMSGMLLQTQTPSVFLVTSVPRFLCSRRIGSFLDAAAEDERVNARTNLLVNLSLDHGSLFWATPERTRQIVRFQDRSCQVRGFLEFCSSTLSKIFNAMFPRNVQPKSLLELMEKFKDMQKIHSFVRAQLIAGAKVTLIMLQIYHPKLDMTKVVETVHTKLRQRPRGVDRINARIAPVAEEIIDDLLRMDADFFSDGHYADFLGAAPEEARVNIDDLLGRN